jgi:ElaB/YqjD/DUF883 family membrane-anchored ribosome-binding protein
MPSETELIKLQMGQTRTALADKLESLETKVLGTVATTTDIVGKTVQEVGTTVRETARDVRAVMHETIDSVRDALDVSRQMQHHPWTMVGGSVLVGYIGGVLLDHLECGRLPSLPIAPERFLPHDAELRERIESTPPARRSSSSFLKALVDSFAPELDKLKAAAIGLAIAAVRDKIGDAVPPQTRKDFTEFMDRVTVKLGGDPHPPYAASSNGATSG